MASKKILSKKTNKQTETKKDTCKMASKYRTWPDKQPDETSDLRPQTGDPDVLKRVWVKNVLQKYRRIKRFVTTVSKCKIVVQF